MFDLKWKKKLYWYDEEDDCWRIHPIAAFATIALAMVILGVIL